MQWGKDDNAKILGSVIPVRKLNTCRWTALRKQSSQSERPGSQQVLRPVILTSSALTVARRDTLSLDAPTMRLFSVMEWGPRAVVSKWGLQQRDLPGRGPSC